MALKKEIQLQFPIPDQMLQVDFLDKWVDANHVLDMELHEAAMEKTDRHGATDVGTLWAVVQKFQKSVQPLPGVVRWRPSKPSTWKTWRTRTMSSS